jgi:enoyl-CoA hydratase/carnithine racemase
MTEQIKIEHQGHVAVLTFHNPPYNHATVDLMRGIADALEHLDVLRDVRAVVLASEGKAFCAGADLVSADGLGAGGDDPLREFYDQAIRIFQRHKPIVAAVQGAAVGAGLGLAVAADFRVASPEARFAGNFVKLGFHPGFALTYTLPRLIGHQRATEMLLTGNRYKTEEVAPWGLVDRIAAPDKLLETAMAFAAEIAENAPLSLLTTRATLRRDLVEQVKAALKIEHQEQLKLKNTEDHAEGLRAVAERRPGNFKGH